MRFTTALGFFIGFTAFACAPVASSVPKLSTASPRSADSIVNNGNVDLRVQPVAVRVVSADQADDVRKKYKSDGYDVDRVYDDREAKFSELKELHALNEIGLPPSLNRVETVLIFAVKANEKSIRAQIEDDLKIKPMRGDVNMFSFAISLEGDSANAWSYIKQNLVSVTVAAREAKAKR